MKDGQPYFVKCPHCKQKVNPDGAWEYFKVCGICGEDKEMSYLQFEGLTLGMGRHEPPLLELDFVCKDCLSAASEAVKQAIHALTEQRKAVVAQ